MMFSYRDGCGYVGITINNTRGIHINDDKYSRQLSKQLGSDSADMVSFRLE